MGLNNKRMGGEFVCMVMGDVTGAAMDIDDVNGVATAMNDVNGSPEEL